MYGALSVSGSFRTWSDVFRVALQQTQLRALRVGFAQVPGGSRYVSSEASGAGGAGSYCLLFTT